jgi:hypothetical protein
MIKYFTLAGVTLFDMVFFGDNQKCFFLSIQYGKKGTRYSVIPIYCCLKCKLNDYTLAEDIIFDMVQKFFFFQYWFGMYMYEKKWYNNIKDPRNVVLMYFPDFGRSWV